MAAAEQKHAKKTSRDRQTMHTKNKKTTIRTTTTYNISSKLSPYQFS